MILAPDIVEAILYGREPSDLSLAKLVKSFPVEWEQQHSILNNFSLLSKTILA